MSPSERASAALRAMVALLGPRLPERTQQLILLQIADELDSERRAVRSLVDAVRRRRGVSRALNRLDELAKGDAL